MTDRLYYADPYRREFDGRVVDVASAGGRTLLTLDRSAFYPTSGGQPSDTGTLGGWRVVDVFDAGDGSVTHVVEPGLEPPPAAGATLRGAIDWPRRFDHMQQHTGQHLLSAAFSRVAGVETISFHLGSESATIDLAKEVAPTLVAAAEDEANRIVWENRPVAISFATAEEAATLPLRKEPARGGTLRLIEIRDFDLSACGGTHVARTGEVGVIAAVSQERFKGGLRVEFVCGARALRRFRDLRDTCAAVGRLLSVGGSDLTATVERLQADVREQKRALSGLQTELLAYRAAELAGEAEERGGAKAVLRAVDADAQGLKTLALAIAARPGHAAVLLSSGRPALAVIARAADVDLRANEMLAALIARFGGKGGGKPDIAQGGGLDAAPGAILEAARGLF